MAREMDELRIRCPSFVAQKFWLYCQKRNETPGGILREFILNEIVKDDAAFSLELKAITGREVWEVYRDIPPSSKQTDIS